jgi:hypothetical protein
MGVKKTTGATGYHLINAGSMTGTSTITSDTYNVVNLDNIGLQCIWTGTATGTITVNGSVDGSTFTSLTFNPALTQPAGSAGNILIDINQFPFPFLNVAYTNATGSGTLNVWLFGKDVN